MEVVRYEYDAWGNPISTTGTLAGTIGKRNPFRYRGYYWDEETGMYYLESRYYDPEIRRFISADDVSVLENDRQDLGNSIFYAYCFNNPINYVDEMGAWPSWATKLAIGAFIIPYMFVYNSQMLMIDASIGRILFIIATALIGMFGISVALEGYGFNFTGILHGTNKPVALVRTFDGIERVLFATAGMLCVIPETRSDIIGLSMMAILIAYQIIVKKVSSSGLPR